jgi:lysophospholipase L1-like esterase
MDEADCNFEMVGSQKTNYRHDKLVSPHEGYSGHRVDFFLNGRDNNAGNNEGIATALRRHSPDIVMLFLGTNDILAGQGISQTVAELDQVIGLVLDAGASVFVANVTPVYRTGVQADIDEYSDQIEAYVAQLANPMVTLIDVRSGFKRTHVVDDDLHPTDAGDALIADAFFTGVQDTGYCTK